MAQSAPLGAAAPATTLDLLNTVQEALAHADAMVNMTYGGAGDAFREMNAALQDSFLWAMAERIDAARRAASQLQATRLEGAQS